MDKETIKEKIQLIQTYTDDERILAQCNLILKELDDKKAKIMNKEELEKIALRQSSRIEDLELELEQYKQALLDIKEIINEQINYNFSQYAVEKMLDEIMETINKTIGEDNE